MVPSRTHWSGWVAKAWRTADGPCTVVSTPAVSSDRTSGPCPSGASTSRRHRPSMRTSPPAAASWRWRSATRAPPPRTSSTSRAAPRSPRGAHPAGHDRSGRRAGARPVARRVVLERRPRRAGRARGAQRRRGAPPHPAGGRHPGGARCPRPVRPAGCAGRALLRRSGGDRRGHSPAGARAGPPRRVRARRRRVGEPDGDEGGLDPVLGPELLYRGAPSDVTAAAAAWLRPVSRTVFRDVPEVVAWRTMPSTYVVCSIDEVVQSARQRAMAARAAARVAVRPQPGGDPPGVRRGPRRRAGASGQLTVRRTWERPPASQRCGSAAFCAQ